METVDKIRKYIKDNVRGVAFINPVKRDIVRKSGINMVSYSFDVPEQGKLEIIGVCDNFGAMPAPREIPMVYQSMTGVGVWLNGAPVSGLTGYQVRDLFRQIDENYVAYQALNKTIASQRKM